MADRTAALRSKPGWALGALLFIAALGFHYTAQYWFAAGLNVMHGGAMKPGYAIALLGACC